MRVIAVGGIATLLSSCAGQQSMHDTDAAPQVIERLDMAMAQYASLDDEARDSVRCAYDRPLSFLFALTERGAVTDSALCEYSRSRAVQMFAIAVDSALTSLDSVQHVLGVVQQRMSTLLPKARIASIYAIMSPYNQSVFTTDSLMLVGLNHYLGAEFSGYTYFEPYQRANKCIEQLPYDVVEAAVGSAYPMSDVDDGLTVLNYLLYQGALVEAKMQLLPDATEADALGYSAEQLAWMQANEAPAWNALITRQLLYSPSELDAERLIAPAPSTAILHAEAPGRAGRYIGHRIVRSYLAANPQTTLEELLSATFYANKQTLIRAHYTPK
jgi:hypothetical protein